MLQYKLVTWHGENETIYYIVSFDTLDEDKWEVVESYSRTGREEIQVVVDEMNREQLTQK